MKKSEIWFGIARLPMDFGMTVLAWLVAYRLRQYADLIPGMHFPVDLLSFPSLAEYLIITGWAAAALVFVFAINQMYVMKNTARIGNEVLRVIFLGSAWLMLIVAYYFLTRQFFFSRLVLGYAWILTIFFVAFGRVAMRILQRYLCKLGVGRRRILLIGENTLSEKLVEKLKSNPAYNIVGRVTSKGTSSDKKSGVRVLGALKDLDSIIKRYRIEEILQTQSDLMEAQGHDIVDFCRERHIQYHFVPDILQVHRTHVDVFHVGGLPMISIKTTPLDGWGKVLKRSFDIAGSALLLTLLSPLFLLIALGIKLDSRGPILFYKKDDGSPVHRVGTRGKLIPFYKFRTMRPRSDSLRYTELATQSHRKDGPLVKIKNDPRITKFGKFLRRWSLDELPQLWSVLKGDLSLVGPRPHLPEEVAKYEKHHKFSLSIKPGITGLAQVNGRSDLDFEQECRFDTYYIENWSLLLDLKILFRTVFVVLGGKGAD